ncbi:MAG: glycosyltransferase family 39 protein [Anaerolineaceae bacterium]|nr:glycosyltransferase family 39 protein [Anaerolineaceae bacterium]
MNSEKSTINWLDKPISDYLPKLTIENLFIFLIILLAIISRFYDLGARVMSHDEVNHVVPAWDLATGKGYKQDPITHGPLQFHLIALSYFMFGDSDFSARIPAALASVAAVAFVLLFFKRYLGKRGHLIGGAIFLVSPYLLFYGRYTRNEGLIELIAVLMIYATLRYLDRGDNFSLMLLTIAHALNFAAKETAYIYMAILLLFLAFQFLTEVIREHWKTKKSRELFVILIVITIGLLFAGIFLGYFNAKQNPTNELGELITQSATNMAMLASLSVLVAVLVGIAAIIVLVKGIGLDAIRHLRTFDLLILNATLVLPLLAAFPINILGSLFGQAWKPTDYSTMGMVRIGIALVIMGGISVAIGFWWKRKIWLKNMAVFWAIFIVFYTTFFTNGRGFFTGIVGSLGYWLDQQAVNRGTQPLYYYGLLQMPFYEYLSIIGFLIAIIFGLTHLRLSSLAVAVPLSLIFQHKKKVPEIEKPGETISEDLVDLNSKIDDLEEEEFAPDHYRVPVLFLLGFFSIMSLLAYSLAGEKMPWLTVHIALPFALTAAWGFDKLIDRIPWEEFIRGKKWISILLLPVVITSFIGFLGSILSPTPPFQGNSLEQLQTTSTFIMSFIMLVFSLYGIIYFIKDFSWLSIARIFVLAFVVLLAFLTIRTSIMASFINYDNGKEFLVYAHADRGPKDILEQVEEISKRTVGDKKISVAYDNDSLYPYWWYFRDYPNKQWYTDKPTRDLLNSPIILASDQNYSKIDSLVKDDYVKYDYIRLVWPMQDYYFLTWERVRYAITDAEMRSALFQIWLNKDYSKYAQIKGRSDLTVATWSPSDSIRMYLRKDIIGQIWNYGSMPAVISAPVVDPYEGQIQSLLPDRVIGYYGKEQGQLDAPRGIAIGPDGSIYVADSRNHRIQRFAEDGTLLNVWGSFADILSGDAPPGTFNEPWGIAIGPDGSVYVTDTWNHRVQKFTAEGIFVTMWGYFGAAEDPEGFWGPRGIIVDEENRVYISDTGNKRIAIFDSSGNFISQFGEAGFDIGQLDEPVGLAMGLNGEIYVSDTWNQRIQVFVPNADKSSYSVMNSWDIVGWYGQSLDNKPFLATDNLGNVYTTDPEGFRILGFQPDGMFITGWGDYSPSSDGFGLPAALAFDQNNGVWVSDAGNSVLLHYVIP